MRAPSALRDSLDARVRGQLVAALKSGGTDIAGSLSGQAAVITTAASTLVTTVQAIPADGSSPEAMAVKESADASRALRW